MGCKHWCQNAVSEYNKKEMSEIKIKWNIFAMKQIHEGSQIAYYDQKKVLLREYTNKYYYDINKHAFNDIL